MVAILSRQKLRKYVRNEFEKDAEKFRENPDEPDDVEEEEEAKDSDASDDEGAAPKRKGELGGAATAFLKSGSKDDAGSDDSDSEDWGDDSDVSMTLCASHFTLSP